MKRHKKINISDAPCARLIGGKLIRGEGGTVTVCKREIQEVPADKLSKRYSAEDVKAALAEKTGGEDDSRYRR